MDIGKLKLQAKPLLSRNNRVQTTIVILDINGRY
jgi:hypothetical protein